jgi:hypothetical protein
MVTDALEAGRHEQRSDRGERSQLRESRGALPDGPARAGSRWTRGRRRKRVRRSGRRGRRTHAVRAGPPGRLAVVVVWAAARPWAWDRLEQLSGADARHVRELCGGTTRRTVAAGPGDPRDDPRGERGATAGTAAHLPGRVRLPVVCAAGRASWPGPLYACGRRSAHRRRVSVYRVVVSELSLRTAVHARHLPPGPARPGGRAVGAEGGGGGRQPRRGGADRARRGEDGALGEVSGGVCRFEPGDARAGGGRSAQRRACAARARGRPGPRRRDGATATRRRGAACRRSRGEGISRACAAVRRARATPPERAGASGDERRRRACVACDRGGRRLRCARVWLRRLAWRAAAVDRHAQHPGGDRALGGAQRAAELVARCVCGGIRAGAGSEPVAHRSWRRLARDGRLGNARVVAIDGVAAALVCDMGAAARRPRR